MVPHSDQEAVYTSKAYNDLLPMYGITRSVSRAGTPTDNAAMEAINGWIKAELLTDFHVTGERPVEEEVDDYIVFFQQTTSGVFTGLSDSQTIPRMHYNHHLICSKIRSQRQ